MGEIKSTLDLVLEKTSHLTLSDEEKKEQKQKDAHNRLAGLLQRYQDGKMDVHKTAEELDRLLQAENGPDEPLVRDQIMERIELDRNNKPWLALLQVRYRIELAGVQSVEEDFRQATESAAAKRKEEIRKELQQLRRISGSAVSPNLDADPTWTAEQQTIVANYRRQLTAALDEMK